MIKRQSVTTRTAIATKRRLVAASCTTLMIATAITAGGTATVASAAPTDYLSTGQANEAVGTVANAIIPAYMAQTNYAGSRVTSAGLEIDLAGAPTAVEAAMIAENRLAEATILIDHEVTSVPIEFREVAYSESELTTLTNTISSDQASWAAQGLTLNSWGPDVDSNTVQIALKNYTPAAASQLINHYGSEVTVLPKSEQAFASDSRYGDSNPWSGGDSIKKNTISGGVTVTTTCTSWFTGWFGTTPTASGGDYAQPTAGHCGTGDWQQNGVSLGQINHSKFGGSIDAEVITFANGYSGLGGIYAGPVSAYEPNSASYQNIYQVATVDTVGLRVCTSGQTDQNVCNVLIQATGRTVNYEGQSISGLVKAEQIEGSPAFTPGDSGGPVWAPASVPANYNQHLWAVAQGMIVANAGSPYSDGWYEPALTICHYFGFHMYGQTNGTAAPDPNC